MLNQVPESPSTGTLTEDMFLPLRLTSTNGSKYYSVRELVKALAQSKSMEAMAQKQQAAMQSGLAMMEEEGIKLRGLFDQFTASNFGLDIVTDLSTSSIGPDSTGVAGAKAVWTFIDEHCLSRHQMLPFDAVVLGKGAGHYAGRLGRSVLLGTTSGVGGIGEFKDFVTLGAGAQPLADRTVILGNTQTTVHSTEPVATRADKRDFSTVDLDLGLDFVLKLNPVRATMDLREDYIDYSTMPLPPDEIEPPPPSPTVPESHPAFKQIWAAYQVELQPWLIKNAEYRGSIREWDARYQTWKHLHSPYNVVPDGTHKREREQLMLIADDVDNVADILNSSFPGVIDSAISGGLDVKSLRTEEMVPVLVKAMQELHTFITGDVFVERVAEKLFHQTQKARAALKDIAREAEQ